MPRSRHQKLKALYIYDYLVTNTDETVGVTVPEIISYLDSLGIDAERKSLYEDIALLTDIYGADIVAERSGKRHEYRLMSREFETAELRLLVDAVQSSKFITRKKSDELIKKLKTLAGPATAGTLTGSVVVSGRIKSMNETIYYNVDYINTAIAENKMITFNYFVWTPQKKKLMRRDGARYLVSPLSLCWADDNYYLIAAEDGIVKHFRVDKMDKIRITDTPRTDIGFNADNYSGKVFGMWNGEEKQVTFRAKNHLAGAVIDRFGKDVMLIPDGDEFTFTVAVRISPQFYGYVCGFGADIKIVAPQSVADEFAASVKKIAEVYR